MTRRNADAARGPQLRFQALWTDKDHVPAELQTILKLKVPVIVQVGGRRMPMGEVLSLVPGAIIELPKPADQELELLVNNIPIAQGAAVKVGENFGLQITAIGTARQRVQAMAGQAALETAGAAIETAEQPAAPDA